MLEVVQNRLINEAAAEMLLLHMLCDMMDLQFRRVEDSKFNAGIVEHNKADLIERNRVMKRLQQASRAYLSWSHQGERSRINGDIGDTADKFHAILFLVIDRCKEDDDLRKIYERIEKSYTSKRHMNCDRVKKNAFGI